MYALPLSTKAITGWPRKSSADKLGNNLTSTSSPPIFLDSIGQSLPIVLQNLKNRIGEDNWTSIELVGHTCNIGNASYNQILAEKRALNVKKWLITQGYNESGISISAKGESNPIADNNDYEKRKLNRRVEIIFYQKASNPTSISEY